MDRVDEGKPLSLLDAVRFDPDADRVDRGERLSLPCATPIELDARHSKPAARRGGEGERRSPSAASRRQLAASRFTGTVDRNELPASDVAL